VLWKNNREVCEKPTCVRCSLSYRRPPQLWRSSSLLGRAVTELDALIVPSRSSAHLHERFAGTVRIEHIPHFVPDASPTPPLVHRRPYFLFVGRHEPIKGLDRLIEAFRRRSSEDLLIAGDGPEREALQRRAADLPNVRFLGWQDSAALDALYRGALAVVVPTRGHESFGLVAVEALSRGTPTIVYGFGALAELAEEGGGITYRSDRQLDAALDRIASSPELREELGRRGRRAYEERWTVESHLARYMELIEELAARRGTEDLAIAAASAVPDLVGPVPAGAGAA
jgi:glycosyltransferase involved in cell wall biosynthesis